MLVYYTYPELMNESKGRLHKYMGFVALSGCLIDERAAYGMGNQIPYLFGSTGTMRCLVRKMYYSNGAESIWRSLHEM
jgi:hypothetical protein